MQRTEINYADLAARPAQARALARAQCPSLRRASRQAARWTLRRRRSRQSPRSTTSDEACRDLALATKLGEELMQQNQALRQAKRSGAGALRAQAEEQVAAAKRELEDAERRRERAASASMDAMRAAWAAGADLSPRASGRSGRHGSWTSPPSTPTARSRQKPRRVAGPGKRGGGDAGGGDAPRARERAAGVGGGAARVARAALQVESAEVGDELHSQQLLATRCHALAQRCSRSAMSSSAAAAV